MAALGGFEQRPRLAVAVSGGPDSMALALLADRWARAQDGAIVTLTVDHGLRPEAADEAARTRAALAARGIDGTILSLSWSKPSRSVQSAARTERYRVLEEWCRGAGVLHLLLGHQREDQAETFLLRLGRGSGLDGLSAMAPVAYRAAVRLVRPLLDIERARLAATCADFGQPFVEDPSNQNRHFARVRLRESLPALGPDGLTVERLAATASHLGRARRVLSGQVAALLAASVRLDPAGFAVIDRSLLAAASGEIGRRALAGLLTTIGGGAHPPRFERLERLYGRLADRGDAKIDVTLAGCRIVADTSGVILAREVAAMAPPVALSAAGGTRWDGRFRLAPVGEQVGEQAEGWSLGALGGDAKLIAEAARKPGADPLLARAWRRIPPVARPTLPCIRGLEAVFSVPHLNYCREVGGTDTLLASEIVFDPGLPLSGPAVGCRG